MTSSSWRRWNSRARLPSEWKRRWSTGTGRRRSARNSRKLAHALLEQRPRLPKLGSGRGPYPPGPSSRSGLVCRERGGERLREAVVNLTGDAPALLDGPDIRDPVRGGRGVHRVAATCAPIAASRPGATGLQSRCRVPRAPIVRSADAQRHARHRRGRGRLACGRPGSHCAWWQAMSSGRRLPRGGSGDALDRDHLDVKQVVSSRSVARSGERRRGERSGINRSSSAGQMTVGSRVSA